jgi:hypothetical protein
MMQKNIFFTVKNFSLQEVTITFWGDNREMPLFFIMSCSYTINDTGAKSVIITYQAVNRGSYAGRIWISKLKGPGYKLAGTRDQKYCYENKECLCCMDCELRSEYLPYDHAWRDKS